MMISEFEQWLRSRTNQEKRPFHEETILAYGKAARALEAEYDHPHPYTDELSRYAPSAGRPSTLSADFIRDLAVTGGLSIPSTAEATAITICPPDDQPGDAKSSRRVPW